MNLDEKQKNTVTGWLQEGLKLADIQKRLLAELGVMLRPVREFVDLAIPHEASAVIARLHAVAQVVERDYEGETARFKARIPPHLMTEFERFVVEAGTPAEHAD